MFERFKKPLRVIPYPEAFVRSVLVDDVTYILHEVKQYKTLTKLTIDMVTMDENGNTKLEKQTISIPYTEEKQLEPFVLNDHKFLWDYRDDTLRYRPEVDKSKRKEINKWFHIVDDDVVWVEKKYAEVNLSPQCLSYSYDDGEGNYYWSKEDKSAHTVFMELYRALMEYQKEDDYKNIYRAFLEVYNDGSISNATYTEWFFDTYSVEIERRKGNYILKERVLEIKDFYYREYIENND